MPPPRKLLRSVPISVRVRRSTACTNWILLASCVVPLIEAGCGGGLDNDNVLARVIASGRSGKSGSTNLPLGGNGGTTNGTAGVTFGTAGVTFGAAGITFGAAGTAAGSAGALVGAAGSEQCSVECTQGRICRKVVHEYQCVTASCGPELVTKLKLPDEDSGLVVLGGDYAYVLTRKALEVADIHNPREPKLVGELAGAFVGIAIDGHRLYLADSANGLAVVDVSIPEQPQLVATAAVIGGASCVRADGAFAYLCAGDEQQKSGYLQVVDIHEPNQPVLRGQLAMPPVVRSLDSAGPLVYLVDGNGQFVVVDATNFDQPTRLASLDVNNALYVKLVGSRAFVGATDLVVIDVTEPARPKQVADMYADDAIRSLDVEGNLVGCAGVHHYNMGSFFRTLDVSDPAQPLISPILGDSAYPSWNGPMLALNDGFAYVAETGDLAVYDVSTPVNRRIVNSMPLQSGHVLGMELRDNYAYLIEMGYGPSGSLQVVNTSDPLHPALQGGLNVLATGLAVNNRNAYLLKMMPEVGAGDEFVQVELYNPYDPPNPRQVAALSFDEALSNKFSGQIGLTPSGDHAYLLGREVISIVRLGQTIDVDHTEDPQLVRTLDLPGVTPSRIRFTATHAFVTASIGQGDAGPASGALLVFDLTEPGDPLQVGMLATDVGLAPLELVGSYAYVGAPGQGLLVMDVSTPTKPRIVGTLDTPQGEEEELAILNDMLYLGKAAVDITDPKHPVMRYEVDIPGTLRRISSAGKLFTISDGFSGKYGGRAAELNYVDPTRCAP